MCACLGLSFPLSISDDIPNVSLSGWDLTWFKSPRASVLLWLLLNNLSDPPRILMWVPFGHGTPYAIGCVHRASIVWAHRIGLARIWFQGIPIGVDLNLQDFSRWSIQYLISPCSHDWLCFSGASEMAMCTLALWTHDDIRSVVAIAGKKTQRIIHWSTHMFSGSCEELALADGETQATDTP